MPFKLYTDPERVPPELDALLTFDHSECQLGACCRRAGSDFKLTLREIAFKAPYPEKMTLKTAEQMKQAALLALNTAPRNAVIGGYLTVHPDTDEDVPAWAPFAVLIADGSEDQPMFLCEDCAGWLESAVGGGQLKLIEDC